jgi:TPP-dependent pyruvate/acetoin dehydrogenase alpha subunit
MEKWKELLTQFSSPIMRLEKYLLRKGLIKESDSKSYREDAK